MVRVHVASPSLRAYGSRATGLGNPPGRIPGGVTGGLGVDEPGIPKGPLRGRRPPEPPPYLLTLPKGMHIMLQDGTGQRAFTARHPVHDSRTATAGCSSSHAWKAGTSTGGTTTVQTRDSDRPRLSPHRTRQRDLARVDTPVCSHGVAGVAAGPPWGLILRPPCAGSRRTARCPTVPRCREPADLGWPGGRRWDGGSRKHHSG